MIYKDGWGLQDPQGSRALPFEQRPLLLFTFGIWLWTFVIRLFLATLIKIDNSILIIPNVEVLFIIVCWGILYFYFVDNGRYLDLIAEFRLVDKKVQRKTCIYILIISLLPFILMSVLFLVKK
jgi:hypothetical protein